MATAEIKNIGPVEHISIPIPEQGGIVVLRGRNGSGKSQSLSAVESLVSEKGRLTARDGALRGEVSAFGAVLTVARSTRRTGELEVTSLHGRLSVAELVDPGLIDQDAADARRIKALVGLAGANANPDDFAALFGSSEAMEAVVEKSTLETTDTLLLASRIKRDMESAARKLEDTAAKHSGHADACRENAAKGDASQPHDATILQAELEAAIREKATLQRQAELAEKVLGDASAARDKLAEAKSGNSLSVADAQANEQWANERVAELKAKRDELAAALADLCAKHELATQAVSSACQVVAEKVTARKQAQAFEATLATWQRQIEESESVQAVSAEALATAEANVAEARTKVEAGAIVRMALEEKAKCEHWQAQSADCRLKAHKLREGAKGTDEILSQMVQRLGCALRVEAGRLILDTKRGATYYAELSHGERWRIALDIAIDVLPEEGLLIVEQEAFESLDPANREAINEQLRCRGVVMLTAEAASGDLRAEVY